MTADDDELTPVERAIVAAIVSAMLRREPAACEGTGGCVHGGDE